VNRHKPRGVQRHGRELSGIFLLDKPVGSSSNQALQQAKRLFAANKAGHTGNLDVQASGLLPVCFGESTKVCQFLLDADKHYVAEITFGQRTTTGDAEGEIISERATEHLDVALIEQEMLRFIGEIGQIPPMHSAIKQHGQPLYKLARQGIEVPREMRHVRIDSFTLLTFEAPRATVDIRCSKGTYVRTLAEDLGESSGCGAHVTALRRAGAGPYVIEAAVGLERLEEMMLSGGLAALDALLLPTDSALGNLPELKLGEASTVAFERGQPIETPGAPASGLLRLYDAQARFIGVGEILEDGRVTPRRLMRPQVSESKEETRRKRA
jgi:tRNA pseudouridine55 synthase